MKLSSLYSSPLFFRAGPAGGESDDSAVYTSHPWAGGGASGAGQKDGASRTGKLTEVSHHHEEIRVILQWQKVCMGLCCGLYCIL